MAFKEDLQASVTELVYSEPLRMPGEVLVLTPTAKPVDPAHLISELRQHTARLRPVPAARHVSPSTFVHSYLERCTHVFLRQDTTRRTTLEPPYSGPYQVLSRREKTLRGRPVIVSTDRVKPAYILNGTIGVTSTRQPQQPRAQHHQLRRHSPPQELRAPIVTCISGLV
jgi:hypothetical protein